MRHLRRAATVVAQHDANMVRFNRRFLAFAREYNFVPRFDQRNLVRFVLSPTLRRESSFIFANF